MHVLGIAQRLHPLPAGAACATMHHISKKMLLLAILLISLLFFVEEALSLRATE